MRRAVAVLVGWLTVAAPALRAQGAQGAQGARAAAAPPVPTGRTLLLVIAGAAGEPTYGAAFHAAALAIADAARTRFALADSDVVYLGEDPARAPGRIAGRSTREEVEGAFARLARRAAPGDAVWVVLVGHGSGQGTASRFNLPGPDLAAADYARLLAPLARQRVAFVNATSASADFARALAAPNRAVVTATSTALERNVTRFARHFADALAQPGADVDKDDAVSLLEAFAYAQREVARGYEAERRLQTEHAQLEDDGDGAASATPAASSSKDGRLAAALVLGGLPAGSDPRLAPLRARRRALEQEVGALRARRAATDSAEYLRELETVLVELSRTGRAIRAIEGGKP